MQPHLVVLHSHFELPSLLEVFLDSVPNSECFSEQSFTVVVKQLQVHSLGNKALVLDLLSLSLPLVQLSKWIEWVSLYCPGLSEDHIYLSSHVCEMCCSWRSLNWLSCVRSGVFRLE